MTNNLASTCFKEALKILIFSFSSFLKFFNFSFFSLSTARSALILFLKAIFSSRAFCLSLALNSFSFCL